MADNSPFFTDHNTLIINTDQDLKNVFSGLNHASFFFSKFFQDTFSVFMAKIVIQKDMRKGMEIAKH